MDLLLLHMLLWPLSAQQLLKDLHLRMITSTRTDINTSLLMATCVIISSNANSAAAHGAVAFVIPALSNNVPSQT